MVVLIAGASHSGKTLLAQRLVEKTHYPCLSLDLLKMGLIRSGQTTLTPQDDEALTACLWPIAREMVKTALENRQNLIVEGCYIPFTWQDSFRPPTGRGYAGAAWSSARPSSGKTSPPCRPTPATSSTARKTAASLWGRP